MHIHLFTKHGRNTSSVLLNCLKTLKQSETFISTMSDLTAPKQSTDGDDAIQEPVLSKRAQRKQKRV